MLDRRTFLGAAGSALLARAVSAASTAQVNLSSGVGTDPTGRSDSAAAVQRFVSANAGRTIVVDGSFRMDAPLQVPSSTRLTGSGTGSGFTFTWTSGSVNGSYISNTDPTAGNTDITLDSFSVQGAGDGLPAGPAAGAVALSFRRGSRLSLRNLTITDVPGIAIAYQGVSTVRITGNTIDGAGRDGIAGWWYTTPMKDVVVSGNTISRIGDDAIAINASAPENPNTVERPSGIQVLDNLIVGHGRDLPNLWGRGILVLGAQDVLIQGNVITNPAAAGILVGSDENASSARFASTGIRILQNTIVGAGQFGSTAGQPKNGIFIADATGLTLDRNTVRTSVEDGLLAADVDGLVLSNSTFEDNGTLCSSQKSHVGISIASTSPTGQVALNGNTVRRSASNGIRVHDAHRATLQGNLAADNGTRGDSRTPLSAGVWVYDCDSGYVVRNTATQSATAAGTGRHSWGFIAECLAGESAQDRTSNVSTGAVVGQLYTGLGRQAGLDLWNP